MHFSWLVLFRLVLSCVTLVACLVFLFCVVSCVCCLSVVLSFISWIWANVSSFVFPCTCVCCFGCLYCVGFLACVSCSLRWAVAGGWCLASLRVLVVVSCRLSFVVLFLLCCCMWLCACVEGRRDVCIECVSVCAFKTTRVYGHHAHMFHTCGLGAGTHGDVLNVHALGFSACHGTPPHRTHNTTTTAIATASATTCSFICPNGKPTSSRHSKD